MNLHQSAAVGAGLGSSGDLLISRIAWNESILALG